MPPGLELPDKPDEWGDNTSWTGDDAGDELVAVADEVREVTSKRFGTTFTVITARNVEKCVGAEAGPDGTIEVPFARAHLRSLLEEKPIAAGDRFGIRAFGRADDSSPYLYALAVDGSPPF